MSSASSTKRIAVVTGGNKGIGYCIVKQLCIADPSLTVLVGSRDIDRGVSAVAQLQRDGVDGNIHPLHIDIDDASSVSRAVDEVKRQYGGIDILVNNAGIATRGDTFGVDVLDRTFATNYFGTIDVTQKFLSIMKPNGRIVSVSSNSAVSALKNMSQEHRDRFMDPALTLDGLHALMMSFRSAVVAGDWLSHGWPSIDDGWPTSAYGISKIGVSLFTRILSSQLTNGIKINSGCPGYCRTDMTNIDVTRTADEGAATFALLCTMPYDELTNGQYWENEQLSHILQ